MVTNERRFKSCLTSTRYTPVAAVGVCGVLCCCVSDGTDCVVFLSLHGCCCRCCCRCFVIVVVIAISVIIAVVTVVIVTVVIATVAIVTVVCHCCHLLLLLLLPGASKHADVRGWSGGVGTLHATSGRR